MTDNPLEFTPEQMAAAQAQLENSSRYNEGTPQESRDGPNEIIAEEPHVKILATAQRERFVKLAKHRAMLQKETLSTFRPLPHQEKVFHSSASELLLRGGNRSGKSVCAALLFGSAATGIPVMDLLNKPIPLYEPHAHAHRSSRPMTMWCIGLGEKHIAQTLYRLLFEKGLFDIIRDEHTNLWRPYDPTTDSHREMERKPSPPVIPSRLIDPKGWGWKEKASNLFTQCTLLNGTKIYAFTSVADAKMGDPVDYIWIDERIRFPKHYSEWQARISDRKGRIVWSVWPGHGSHVVLKISERAQKQEAEIERGVREKPDVEELVLRFSDNPYIDEDEKRKRREGWSEEEIQSRDYGEFVTGPTRIYPNFSESVHGAPPRYSSDKDLADEILERNEGMPPDDWCRGLIVDPGHTHPGALFTAIAPPDVAKSCGTEVYVVYNELYLPGTDARMMAKHVRSKAVRQQFQYFIIDSRAGRKTPEGFSKTIREHYEDAFAKEGLRCISTGGSFRMSSDDLMGGIECVRGAMYIGPTGRPVMRIITKAVPNFIKQVAGYQKEEHPTSDTEVGEKPAPRQIDPLCDCLRYWCAGAYQYIKPKPYVMSASPALTYFREEWKPKKKEESMQIYCGPGSGQ